ncbi:MAG TPA: hypothetical protein VFB38_06205 [Chthonomonadaceae bacterium]|nr:hypothetical protein [Chthonomonadaceae bacterium]
MAIRIGLPPPLLSRLRFHWHTTHTQCSHQVRSLRASANRTAEKVRDRWRHASERLAARLSPRARALARQRARLASFEEKYEDLVALLCWAAKEGVQPDHQPRYAALRAWMRAHYRPLRPHLRPYWAGEADAGTQDPFEALFLSANLEEVINAATGIENLMRTRFALEAYHDALNLPDR